MEGKKCVESFAQLSLVLFGNSFRLSRIFLGDLEKLAHGFSNHRLRGLLHLAQCSVESIECRCFVLLECFCASHFFTSKSESSAF
ncbi:hypothetical protein CCR85_14245 [Rhodothalassium salexigens]|nr:hypothetical protein [Rhodothalassium salexigens]